LAVQTRFLVARATKQAPKPKRAGRSLLGSLLFASAKRRGGKRIAGLKRRKPAPGKEEPPPFWRGECFFVRAGNQFAWENGLYSQNLLKNITFSEINSFSFSAKLEMIHLS
jgi:hypothetical protein